VADNLAGVVGVRDSKNLAGPVLTFQPAGWRAFVDGVKSGAFGEHGGGGAGGFRNLAG
jgi:hypothetical protein